MFSDHSWNQLKCSHGFEEDESEVLRLRRLFHESILKVEKENMEIIREKMLDKKLFNEKELQLNKATKIGINAATSKSSVTTKLFQPKTINQRRQEPKTTSESKKNSNVQLPNLNNAPKCETSKQECQFSTIHFLNHFHTAFVSSRKQASICDRTAKYIPCAIPLSPPIQVKDPVVLNTHAQVNEKIGPSSNVALHHVVSGDVPKKLAVQVLPSISIINKKPNYTKNVLVEEVTKRDYFEGDGIKTTILPALTNAERSRISGTNLNADTCTKISVMCDKTNQSDILEPKISSFTQTENFRSKIFDASEEKAHIKDIVKEILLELQLIHHNADVERNVNVATQKDLVSPENDCELDSFLGNADSLSKPPVYYQIEKKHSAYTQTSHSVEVITYPKEQMRELIQEVISELQHHALPHAAIDNFQAQALSKMEKANKEVQTFDSCSESAISSASKSVQVEIVNENSEKCDAAVSPEKSSVDDIFEDSISKIPFENAMQHAVHVGEIPGTTEKAQKLEFLLNSIYERFCLENESSSINSNPLPRDNASTITTRDVSVQFNPIFTLTKSTCTSDIMRVDAAHQCELISEVTEGENVVSHVSVQTELLVTQDKPSLSVPIKINTCIQCERPALIDSHAQTSETWTTLQPSEHSTDASVSTTPVSDSMFLDDMLSEGEIFLPWNLRLLSSADKIGMQNSRNDAEAIGSSDKEKDYSLSEGEIHPWYFLQMSIAQSSSCDSSVDTCPGSVTHNHPYPYLLQRSPGEINPGARSCYGDLYRYSSSSLSEGEVRNSSTLSSEGEVRFSSSSLRPSPSPFQRDTAQTVHSDSEDVILNYQSEFSSNVSQKSHLSSCISESRITSGTDDASLSTVTEET